jgi:hypothetical protein
MEAVRKRVEATPSSLDRHVGGHKKLRGIMGGLTAIQRLLLDSTMSPDEIRVLVSAYKKTLHALSLVDRNDPLTGQIAQKLIEIRKSGLRDPAQIATVASRTFSFPSAKPPERSGLAPLSCLRQRSPNK